MLNPYGQQPQLSQVERAAARVALLEASYAWDAMSAAERDAFVRENRESIRQATIVSVWLRLRAYNLSVPTSPRIPGQRQHP